MVQPINHLKISMDNCNSNEILLHDFTKFVTKLNQLILEKQIKIPLDLKEITKICCLDISEIALYLKTLAMTFNIFTQIQPHNSSDKKDPCSIFPKRTLAQPLPSKVQSFRSKLLTQPSIDHKSPPNDHSKVLSEYTITLDELKNIADLFYISSIHPVPLDILHKNTSYTAILQKYPAFFLIQNQSLQLTACAQYFTKEFLKCKKVKADIPKSLRFSEPRFEFILYIK